MSGKEQWPTLGLGSGLLPVCEDEAGLVQMRLQPV